MSDTTVNLEMPYILPSQAQKHVTHNEALQRLDAIVQLTLSAMLATPPASAGEGECFAITAPASGDWSGRDGRIAMWQDGAWLYLAPRTGWRAWDAQARTLLVHDGEDWGPAPLPAQGVCQTLGVSTTADTANRLAVAAPATLLTHAGGDHQLKINKAAPADTASLLFQSDWTGFAEMGLAGNNSFAVKVSDGTDWVTALAIAPTGHVQHPRNPAFRAWCDPATMTPAPGSQTGFQQIANLQGTASLGAPLTRGAALVIAETGLYLLNLHVTVITSSGHDITLVANGTTEIATLKGDASGATSGSLTTIAWLNTGDSLFMSHAGNAQLECGQHKTELTGVML